MVIPANFLRPSESTTEFSWSVEINTNGESIEFHYASIWSGDAMLPWEIFDNPVEETRLKGEFEGVRVITNVQRSRVGEKRILGYDVYLVKGDQVVRLSSLVPIDWRSLLHCIR